MNNHFYKKANKFLTFRDLYKICNLPNGINFKDKILDVNNIKDANNSEITFLNNSNYLKDAKKSKALEKLLIGISFLVSTLTIFLFSKSFLEFSCVASVAI